MMAAMRAKILPPRGRWPEGPEGASAQTQPKPNTDLLSGSPLSRFATAPPEEEHPDS
jgi:hypothetical protein